MLVSGFHEIEFLPGRNEEGGTEDVKHVVVLDVGVQLSNGILSWEQRVEEHHYEVFKRCLLIVSTCQFEELFEDEVRQLVFKHYQVALQGSQHPWGGEDWIIYMFLSGQVMRRSPTTKQPSTTIIWTKSLLPSLKDSE